VMRRLWQIRPPEATGAACHRVRRKRKPHAQSKASELSLKARWLCFVASDSGLVGGCRAMADEVCPRNRLHGGEMEAQFVHGIAGLVEKVEG
jgi:hypothetical protein